ncbi:MAG TPA: twin-arginine translocation signal domain-containing protein, partial [Candidatus Eisenbacteria bacterium]|nr:twin-arginine translocation signal domain-containing protein [Candidatus Eisenbacteria bacterium]
MTPNEIVQLTRRDFLATAASGIGGLAFASLLNADGLLAADSSRSAPHDSRAHA